MFRPPSHLSRRTALGLLGVGAVACATGCSASSTLDSLRPTPLPTPSAPTNPDRPVLDQVVARIRAADAGAPSTFTRPHATQLHALGARAASAAPSASATGDQWRRQQTRLAADLAAAAAQAHDPRLVRLLASMAAAQRQLLTVQGLA